jgi:hypothetical protein
MSIILLRGFSHSGKDFIGQILCNIYGYERFAFADSLKKIIQDKFNCSYNQLHTQEGKIQICQNDPLKRTYRQILIDEALYLRNYDKDIFAKHCCNEIYKNTPNTPKKIVITDWRYSNEITVLEQAFPGYKIIPVYIQRVDQYKSPINDDSEYQLITRTNDYTLINKMNETIFEEVENLIKYINNI